jgi:isopentenyl-diphosphate delta-isomerase
VFSASDEEQIILVDRNNRAVGNAEKHAVHRSGLLHRAFSVFLCDAEGRVLLQQRHAGKYHSGGLWANSCCGHPRVREQTRAAARRRVGEELGVDVDLTFGFRTRYSTSFANGLHENEIVYVYFGPLTGRPSPDPSEVADLRLAGLDEVRREALASPERYAYWLGYYMDNHFDEIASGVRRAAGAARMPAQAMRRSSMERRGGSTRGACPPRRTELPS